MKSLILLIFIFASAFSGISEHDIPLAHFSLRLNEGQAKLEAHFNSEDFEKSIGKPIKTLIKDDVLDYLQERTVWSISGKSLKFQITEMKITDDHLKVSLFAEWSGNYEGVLKMKNTCLIGIDNHSNIVDVIYQDKTRTFRLHKRRTFTEMTF